MSYETAVHLSQGEDEAAATERGSRAMERRVARELEAIIVASGLDLSG